MLLAGYVLWSSDSLPQTAMSIQATFWVRTLLSIPMNFLDLIQRPYLGYVFAHFMAGECAIFPLGLLFMSFLRLITAVGPY